VGHLPAFLHGRVAQDQARQDDPWPPKPRTRSLAHGFSLTGPGNCPGDSTAPCPSPPRPWPRPGPCSNWWTHGQHLHEGVPRPPIWFSSALRMAFLVRCTFFTLFTAQRSMNTGASRVFSSSQARIGIPASAGSARTARSWSSARPARWGHLPPGHAVDGIVHEHVVKFSPGWRVDGFGGADGQQVAVTLVGNDTRSLVHPLQTGGHRLGPAVAASQLSRSR